MTGTHKDDEARQPGPPGIVLSSNGLGVSVLKRCDLGMRCEHLRCTYEGMDGERYRCDRCGKSVFLDYEEMR